MAPHFASQIVRMQQQTAIMNNMQMQRAIQEQQRLAAAAAALVPVVAGLPAIPWMMDGQFIEHASRLAEALIDAIDAPHWVVFVLIDCALWVLWQERQNETRQLDEG